MSWTMGEMVGRRVWAGALALVAAATALAGPARAEVPNVVVTIRPVHSLVAAVMDGAGEPDLLIEAAASPHTYALKPSDVLMLTQANVVFWVGADMETFLERPLQNVASDADTVSLIDAEGISFPSPLVALVEVEGEDDHAAHDDHGEHDSHDEPAGAKADAHHHDGSDPHIWLNPANAIAMVRTIRDTLSAHDRVNAALYEGNADRLITELRALDDTLARDLAPIADRTFVVYHDAYSHFTTRYGLSPIGSVAVEADRSPGAEHIATLRQVMDDTNAVCLFSEPQFSPRLAETVAEGSSVRLATLDPLGTEIEAGPALYPALLRTLAADLRECLSTTQSSG